MLNFLKNIIANNKPIPATTNVSDNNIYLSTFHKDYTFDELVSLKTKLLSYKSDHADVDVTIKQPINYIIGTIEYIDHAHRRYGASDRMHINLHNNPAEYYINICKSINYLCNVKEASIHLNKPICHLNACNHIVFDYAEWFHKVNNFYSGTTFKSKPISFTRDESEPSRCVVLDITKFNETEFSDAINKLPEMAVAYFNYKFKQIKTTIEEIINQFPDTYYKITILDGKKSESMYTLNPPRQDDTGSYRIDGVLFRGDYFVLIPAVMYKIDVESFTKTELTKKLIQSCDSTEMRLKLKEHFSV